MTKVTTCQDLCKTYTHPECTFFVYNKEQLTCEMFDTDIQIYKDSCHKLGLTPDVEVPSCYNSTDSFLADPCLVSTFFVLHFAAYISLQVVNAHWGQIIFEGSFLFSFTYF